MVRKSVPYRRSGISSVYLLVPVLIVGALGFLVWQQADAFIGRSLVIALGDAENTYHGVWFTPDGDVVAKDLTVYPLKGGEEVTLHFDTVRLDTPDWLWFVRNTLDRKLQHAELDRIHLTLGGATSTVGHEPTLGELGPIGATSASPFEAAGCMANDTWRAEELVAMGLSSGKPTLDLDYRIEDTHLLTTIVLDTPGVSTARMERREQLPQRVSALQLGKYPTMTQSERWQVRDQGFVKARNAYCAKKDGTDVPTFVTRHVDTVLRLMAIAGMAPDPASIEVYRNFASEGGEITFGGDYAQPLHSSERRAAHDSGMAWLRMNGLVERKAQHLTVQWQRLDPRPLKGLDSLSAFAALQRERGIGPAAKADDAAVASTTPTAPAATAAVPVAAAAAPTTTPAAASAPTMIAGRRVTASSFPAVVTPLAPPGSKIAWSDMPRYRGHLFQIWTAHNPPRTMTLVNANGSTLDVQARLGGGSAKYRIGKDAFLRAVLIQ